MLPLYKHGQRQRDNQAPGMAVLSHPPRARDTGHGYNALGVLLLATPVGAMLGEMGGSESSGLPMIPERGKTMEKRNGHKCFLCKVRPIAETSRI